MNFFEHQDRAQAHTQKLLGLFALSVLCIVGLIYAATIVVLYFSGTGSGSSQDCLTSSAPETGTQAVLLSSQTTSPTLLTAGSSIKSDSETMLVSRRSRSSRSSNRNRSNFSGGSNRPNTSSPDNRSGNWGDGYTLPRSPDRSRTSTQQSGCAAGKMAWWQPHILFWVCLSTVTVIGGASWYKIATLQAGGSVVAQELGGRLLIAETASPQEQQLLNVVEEMAIAANIKVPAVYLLDHERGINAFAAGHTIETAVIGVTQGCLDQLTRDELQGVIGHEFSHILNGDMRLNLRLIGLLYGILFVYLTGRILLEWDSRDYRWLWFLGLALALIGSIGLFFGRLIQSAISRQREYLADASAVQFTRNPDGIAGALTKIGNFGSQIRSPQATATSHLFFGNALSLSMLDDLWATHPPLLKRIQRLGGLQGDFAFATEQYGGSSHALSYSGMAIGFAGGSAGAIAIPNSSPQSNPDLDLQKALHQPEGATAIVYGLLLHPEFRDRQIEYLRQIESAAVVDKMLELSSQIEQIKPRERLPLLDRAVPTLRQTHVKKLFAGVQGFARVEGQWSMFKFIVLMILQQRLAAKPQPEEFSSLSEVWSDCEQIIAAIAQAEQTNGQTNPDTIAYAFRSGLLRLPGASGQALSTTPPTANFNQLKQSLTRLGATSTKLRQAIVDACSYTVLLDSKVTDEEAELLWMVAVVLDCPLPPFLEKRPVAARRK